MITAYFPDTSIRSRDIFKLFYPQRTVDFPKAFRELGLAALGATLRGTQNAEERIAANDSVYLGWVHPHTPSKGFLVYWNEELGALKGFSLDLATPEHRGDIMCDLCMVTQRPEFLRYATFRAPQPTRNSVSHYVCANLGCTDLAVGRSVPQISTGYIDYPPSDSLQGNRLANIFMRLHEIETTLQGEN